VPAALRPAAPPPGNRLLAAPSRAERALLAGALQPVLLRRGQVLLGPGEETATLILPEGGLVSLLLELPPWPGRDAGLVSLSRGQLAVLDATGLAARACPCLAAARSLPGWPAPGGALPPPAGTPRGSGVSAG
jgi:hypothetical protein